MNMFLDSWHLFVLIYFFTINTFNTALVYLAYLNMRGTMRRSWVVQDKELFRHAALNSPISILVPAYNEEPNVVTNVHSLLSLNYQAFEVIVINDGSKDATLQRLIDEFDLYPVERANPNHISTQAVRQVYLSHYITNLVVVDKENGGKADALNAGLNVSRNPLIAVIDTDSILERNVLLMMARPFMEDPEVVAVGGVVRVVNGCVIQRGQVTRVGMPRNWLARMQVLEYLRAFLFGRAGWEALGMLMIISGAFGMFRKEAMVAAEGFRHDTVGEDMELVVRIRHRFAASGRKYKVRFMGEPVCWTEVPETLAQLGSQRDRWQRGLLDSMFSHRTMLLNPRYGRIGMVAMPYYILFEGLGPLVEVAGLVSVAVSASLGRIDLMFGLAFFCAAILLGVVMSLSALALEELTFHRYPGKGMILMMVFLGIAENFGYRQLNSWWRLKGTLNYLRGSRQWGEMARRGFSKPGDST